MFNSFTAALMEVLLILLMIYLFINWIIWSEKVKDINFLIIEESKKDPNEQYTCSYALADSRKYLNFWITYYDKKYLDLYKYVKRIPMIESYYGYYSLTKN